MKMKTAGVVAVVLVALLAATVASAMAFSGWGPAQAVAELNTTSSDGCPIQSPDGLSFYLASNRTGTLGGLDIWVATRNDADDPWSTPANLGAPINSSADDFAPRRFVGAASSSLVDGSPQAVARVTATSTSPASTRRTGGTSRCISPVRPTGARTAPWTRWAPRTWRPTDETFSTSRVGPTST